MLNDSDPVGHGFPWWRSGAFLVSARDDTTHTTDKWGKNAEDALDDQAIPVQRINLADIAESPIDWDIAWPKDSLTIALSPAERKQPRPHQVEAIACSEDQPQRQGVVDIAANVGIEQNGSGHHGVDGSISVRLRRRVPGTRRYPPSSAPILCSRCFP